MKKWFEDWEIKHDGKSEIVVKLPNGFGKKTYFFYLEPAMARALASILMAAFDQIQKDNGGYKK